MHAVTADRVVEADHDPGAGIVGIAVQPEVPVGEVHEGHDPRDHLCPFLDEDVTGDHARRGPVGGDGGDATGAARVAAIRLGQARLAPAHASLRSLLEELLKVAIDRGDVYRTESGWERRALSEFSLPATVRDSVLLRVGRLPPEQVEVLRIAAVLGRSFDDELLRDLCGKEIEDDLEAFIDQQLVDEEPGQSGRYRFRHALTQQAIYDSISRRKRERLHGEAAAALRSRSAVTAVELASHLLLAKHTDEALPLLLEAAEDAERARG